MTTAYAINVGAEGLTGGTLTSLLTAGTLSYGPRYPEGVQWIPRNNPNNARDFNFHKKYNGWEGINLSFVYMTYADWYRIRGYCGDPAETTEIYLRIAKQKGSTSTTAEKFGDYSGKLDPPEQGYPIVGGRGDVVLHIEKLIYIQDFP